MKDKEKFDMSELIATSANFAVCDRFFSRAPRLPRLPHQKNRALEKLRENRRWDRGLIRWHRNMSCLITSTSRGLQKRRQVSALQIGRLQEIKPITGSANRGIMLECCSRVRKKCVRTQFPAKLTIRKSDVSDWG